MQAFPKYDSYKESGVEWIGEIPKEWKVCRNLGLFSERKEVNKPEMELLSVTIKKGVIKQGEITIKKDSSNEDKSKYKVVNVGDLAYNKMRMWQGAIGMSKYDGIVSPAYIILNTRNKKYAQFFHYLYRTGLFIKEANRHSYGLCGDMNSLRYEDFKAIYSPVPPENEIDRIVNFLDQKTAEIDETITKKKRLIELLKEQKAILINRAVTKGLNPDTPMRDSGIEWIGKIPKHWEKTKLKYFIDLLSGFAFKSSQYSVNNTDIPLLRGININPGIIKWGDVVFWSKEKVKKLERYLLKEDDLVIGMDRPWIKSGIRVAKVAANDIPSLLLQRVARIRSIKGLQQDYLEQILKSDAFLAYFEPMMSGISVPHISPEQIANFETYIPPKDEQIEICKTITRIFNESNLVIEKEIQGVLALEEYKSIIISEAVTGKIKIEGKINAE